MLDRIRIGGFSGTYRIRNAELARDRKQRTISVSVLFLDDTQHVFHLDKKAKGSELLDQVFRHLELTERYYFGLKFLRASDVVRWVDPNKSFRKQWNTSLRECGGTEVTSTSPFHTSNGDSNDGTNGTVAAAAINDAAPTPVLAFSVKFYVTDPSRLQEEYTRYQFYLQIKRDILNEKLPVTLNTACVLASYTIQSELGDFNPLEHRPGYLSDMQLLVDQTEENERRCTELHKLHRGQLPADAEYNYLDQAKRLDMYGIDFHKGTDVTGKELQLGVSSIGLLVYQNGIRVNTFSWSKMVKVSFKRKDFFIQLRRELSESYDTLLGFSMGSHKNAKALWKACVEHHSFFRLQRPHCIPKFLLITLGSKFHYSGFTEHQAHIEGRERNKGLKQFERSSSKRRPSSSTSSPLLSVDNGSSTDSSNSNNNVNKTQLSILRKPNTSIFDNKVHLDIKKPQEGWPEKGDPITDPAHLPIAPYVSILPGSEKSSKLNDEYNVVTIKLEADAQGRFGFNVKGGVEMQSPVLVSRVAPNTPASRATPPIREGDQVLLINERDVSGLMHEEIVNLIRSSHGNLLLTIKLNPIVDSMEDEPIYQYVAENLSNAHANRDPFTQSMLLLADGLASGQLLNHYEQLYRRNSNLAITEARKPEHVNKNRYRDISPYDCTRVILQNSESGDYINANYVNMEIPGGPITRYIATQGPLNTTVTDFWRMVQQESSHLIVMLTTVVERGRPKCHQYWPAAGDDPLVLAEGFSIKCLKEQADETGSFVFRDFVLSDSRTGEVRTIQHMQYLVWPDHGVPSDVKQFLEFTQKVRSARTKSLLEEIDDSLKNVKLIDADEEDTVGERWLTNGDSPNELPVTTSIHQCISAANPPTIVHCSAGIGRTGVLILMDTAMALLELQSPIYPLELVQTMRDQRASMVQNASQYRFVCECICAAYSQMIPTKE